MRALFAIVVVALAACGPRAMPTSTSTTTTIHELRARATNAPSDPDAWRALAEGEMWMRGGEAARIRPTIDHGLRLSPSDPTLLFLSALEHEQHGRFAEAFALHLSTVDAARASGDPIAPALAEISLTFVQGFSEDVTDARQQIAAVAERVVAEPVNLGQPARDTAGQILISTAFRAGDLDWTRAAARRIGCLDGFRVAGPFGPSVLLGFDEPPTASGRGPLAEEYDLLRGQGTEKTREAEQHGCSVSLGGGSQRGGGTFVAESFVEIAEPGPHLVAVETNESWVLRLDGEEVGRADARNRMTPRYAYRLLELEAGRHELELSVTTRRSSPNVSLAVVRRTADFDPAHGTAYPEATSPFDAAVRGYLARVRGDTLEAREAFSSLVDRRATAAALIARADASLDDPFLPEGRGRDEAKALYERAARQDPNAYYPRFQLARMAPTPREYLVGMVHVVEHWPNTSLRLSLAELYEERGLTADAEAQVAAAAAAVPNSCAVLGTRRERLLMRGRYRDAESLLTPLLACDARSRERFSSFIETRRFDQARAELERLRPLVEEEVALRLDMSLARALGDRARLDALRDELRQRNDVPGAGTLERIDRMWAGGQHDEAIAAIDAALDDEDGIAPGLRRIRRTLAGEDWLDAYRIDGARVIREYEASGASYDEHGQVLVFDYMVTRVRPDGSATDLVHQIMRVQSEESLERLGQVSIPGRVLTLRSIKPDGRRLEPDRIAGLSSIPLTTLAVGDYVEFEYVREHGAGRGGSFQSDGWVFQSFTQPFHLSQMVMVVPEATTLVVDSTGPVPEPEVRVEDGLRTFTWTVHGSAPLTPEPGFVPHPPVLPRLSFAVGVTLDDRVDALRDLLADRDPYDPAAERAAIEILGDAARASAAERARMLHRWVVDNIEAGGGLDGSAPLMLAARTGHRTRVLRYLLGLVGITSDLVLARTDAGREPGNVPELDLYDAVLLRVHEGREESRIVFADARFLPYDYVPPAVRGQTGIVLATDNPRITIEDPGSDADRRDTDIDVRIDDSGVRISIIETHRGASALFWRRQLEQTPRADLERGFESAYAARLVPGSQLEELTIEGADAHEEPLVLRYRLRVSELGRRTAGHVHVPPMFAATLAGRFAALPTRTTTQMVAGAHQRVRLRLRGPAGAPDAPPDSSFEGPGGARFTQRARATDDAILVERVVDVPRQLVPAASYGAFAEFCRRVDGAEAAEIAVPLP